MFQRIEFLIVSRSPSLSFLSLQLLKVCLAAVVKNVSPLLTCQTPNLNGSTVCQLFMVLDAGDIAPDINIRPSRPSRPTNRTTDRPIATKKVKESSEWAKDCCCCCRYRSCYFSRSFSILLPLLLALLSSTKYLRRIFAWILQTALYFRACACVSKGRGYLLTFHYRVKRYKSVLRWPNITEQRHTHTYKVARIQCRAFKWQLINICPIR